MGLLSTFGSAAARAYGFTRSAIASAVDQYFNLTTLLLPGNGTNGAQNNTFLDSSTNNFTITRNGNTTQGTFSPFSQTGWSNYFNGSSYLSVANNANLNLGSSSFTIEFWVYGVSSASPLGLISKGNTTSTGTEFWSVEYTGTAGQIAFYSGAYNGAGTSVVSGTVTLNSWNHVAVVRNGNTHTMYINGVASSTATASYTVTNAGTLYIGTGAYAPSSRYSTGYISNARIVIGSVVYTSNFTPSTTPLTAITNTQLLTCQDNRFIDNSSNAFAITVNGTPSVQAFSPFAPTAAYDAATNGGSMFNSATPDGLKFLTSTTQFGISGDFTIELWLYPTAALTAYNPIWHLADSTGSDNPSAMLFYDGSYNLFWLNNGAGGNGFDTGASIKIVPFQWNHIAISRSGANIRCWTNGVLRISNWSAGSIDANKRVLYLATNRAGNDVASGYMSGFRFVNGTAVYSGASNFTPPTTPPTAITNTVALVNCTNAGITDATAKNVLQTVGNAQISTTQSKFGGGSIAFDGTGDRLHVVPNNTQNLVLGTGDFTIELWLRPTSLPSVDCLLVGGDTNAAYLILTSAGALRFGTYNVNWIIGPAGTVSTGAWSHVAVTRSGTTVNLFLNGTAVTTAATSSQNFSAASYVIGGDQVGGTTALNGFIDDLRITKGYARYTANFTPPTAAFQVR